MNNVARMQTSAEKLADHSRNQEQQTVVSLQCFGRGRRAVVFLVRTCMRCVLESINVGRMVNGIPENRRKLGKCRKRPNVFSSDRKVENEPIWAATFCNAEAACAAAAYAINECGCRCIASDLEVFPDVFVRETSKDAPLERA